MKAPDGLSSSSNCKSSLILSALAREKSHCQGQAQKKKELEKRILQATRSVEKSAVVHRVVIKSDLVSFLVDAWAFSFDSWD